MHASQQAALQVHAATCETHVQHVQTGAGQPRPPITAVAQASSVRLSRAGMGPFSWPDGFAPLHRELHACPGLSAEGAALISSMLEYDPSKRITAAQVRTDSDSEQGAEPELHAACLL